MIGGGGGGEMVDRQEFGVETGKEKQTVGYLVKDQCPVNVNPLWV